MIETPQRPRSRGAARPPRAGWRGLVVLAAVISGLSSAPRDVRAAFPPGGAWIRNVASGTATDSASGAQLSAVSDTVSAWAAPAAPPSIAFYTDPGYGAPSSTAHTGDPLYLQANASACDLDPSRVDSVRITVRSARTGDLENFTARETGPATGI